MSQTSWFIFFLFFLELISSCDSLWIVSKNVQSLVRSGSADVAACVAAFLQYSWRRGDGIFSLAHPCRSADFRFAFIGHIIIPTHTFAHTHTHTKTTRSDTYKQTNSVEGQGHFIIARLHSQVFSRDCGTINLSF